MSIPSPQKLRLYIERLENLEHTKAELMEDISEVFAEAKGEGFDLKVLRTVLKIRKMKPQERAEQEELVNLYLSALSALPSGTSSAA